MLNGGAFRDPIDERDYRFADLPLLSASEADLVLDPWRTPISRQSGPDCVANAVADACELLLPLGSDGYPLQLSRRFVGHEALRQAGLLDAPFRGSHVRAAVSAIRRVGICQEGLWSYDRDIKLQPGPLAYMDAETRRGWRFHRCSGLEDVDRALSNGLPVVASFGVGSHFSRAVPGTPVEPDPHAAAGHAAVLVHRAGDAYRLRNSWGVDWCDRGTCLVSAAFVEACWDLWVIEAP